MQRLGGNLKHGRTINCKTADSTLLGYTADQLVFLCLSSRKTRWPYSGVVVIEERGTSKANVFILARKEWPKLRGVT